MSCSYKLISRLSAHRLKGVLQRVVAQNRGVFISGRQILDGILVANELLGIRRRKWGIGFILKLDTEKASDHVNWLFLIWVLEQMGFRDKLT